MNQAPRAIFTAKNLRYVKLLVGFFPGVSDPRIDAFDRDRHREIRAHDRGDFLLRKLAFGELRGGPIEPRPDFAPAALKSAKAAQYGDVFLMRIELLGGLALPLTISRLAAAKAIAAAMSDPPLSCSSSFSVSLMPASTAGRAFHSGIDHSVYPGRWPVFSDELHYPRDPDDPHDHCLGHRSARSCPHTHLGKPAAQLGDNP